ncbi:CLUMA_CG003899, isoform A [Clunio marinus]|uniref:CLUMA_CG003899, isoform A n=1 Tax=Clunio marinus TaxID=568069 RepID=A0A1J1HVL1_9DIPT|nr:CLUMA_CG003899, isoform A [Clunio marinus]
MRKENNLKIQECDKLNVLCLHGYRQSAESFKSKTGSFRKFCKNYANFTYINAPHLAKPFNEDDEPVEEQRSWWFNKDDGSFKGTNQSGPAIGFEASLKVVEDAWASGDYQGLMGFSQGASFISVICSLSERSLTNIKPKFVLMAAGFLSGSLVHKNCYENRISIPSLHIYGSTDEIIPHEMSLLLEGGFEYPKRIQHSGGHYFPATVNEKQPYINFFQDQLQKYLEDRELKTGVTIEEQVEENADES